MLNVTVSKRQVTHTQVSTGLVCSFVYSLRLQGAPDCEVYSAQADRRGDGNVKETRKMKQVNATEVGTIRGSGVQQAGGCLDTCLCDVSDFRVVMAPWCTSAVSSECSIAVVVSVV